MIKIPESVSFQEAISLTQVLLQSMELGEMNEGEIQEVISSLVHTENGARGFFVTYLPDDRPFADRPSPAVLQALQTSPDVVSELLVKNLAMSAAMVLTHSRNGDEGMAQSSARVRQRSANLIQQLQLEQLKPKLQQLYHSVVTTEGEYAEFLQRWGYDPQQRQAIQEALLALE